MKERLRVLVGPRLSPEQRARLARETAESNRRRCAALLPLMAVAHVVHVGVFFTRGAAERAALDPQVLLWRDGVAATHAVTFVFAIGLAAIALRRAPESPLTSLVGPLTALLYLLHGAIIVAVDQLTITSVTPFVGYALGIAVVIALTPRVAVALYAIALAAFVGAMFVTQPSPNLRLATLPNGASIVAISVVLSWLFSGVRRKDLLQRVTIEEQRETLAKLNEGLERRVGDQVAEIVKHAEEVERLNAHLRAQVKARSTELSLALARLASQKDSEGVLQKGVVLGDRFEIDERIGAGGMGTVYSGFDRRAGERVAIKVVQASSTQERDALHRFLREAASAATVSHPAVVRVLHVDVSEDGMFFQVQELVDGVTLQHRIHGDVRWEAPVVARLGSVLCAALAAAHAHGVVHRDVKPANVMLTRAAPGLRLLDFGIAKLYEDAFAAEGGTRTGAIVGTPAYMAPEQVDGRDVTDRADVYAVGVILFLLLTGKLPFGDATPRRMLVSHVLVPAPDARSLEPNVPPALAELVARCLGKEPSERPSADDVGRTLAAFADAEGAAPLHEVERAWAGQGSGRTPQPDLPATVVAGRRPA